MAPLSLKVVSDGGVATKTVVFESCMKVTQAQAIVEEKVLTAGTGKDHGLFLASADDAEAGIWLEGHRTLDYYMLRDGDSLHYLCRIRNLKVKILDGSVKTLQVDESKPISDLMVIIAIKIGILNHEEYGLCREEPEEGSEHRPASVASLSGTLTLKKKSPKQKDEKLEQLSKKLKTDDNVQWLEQHKTLRELGVRPSETVLLQRRLFVSDRNVDARDPVQLNLLYLQARDAILNQRHPVTEDKAGDCKARWINIRDTYRRLLRWSLIHPYEKRKKYKYHKEMSFIRPYYKDNLLKNTLAYRIANDDPASTEDAEDRNVSDVDNEVEVSNTDSEDAEMPLVTKTSKTRKKIEEQMNYTSESETAIASTSKTEVKSSDPVDAFLLSIGATLKTFSPYHLNLAKSKIFSVVQEHELQQIMETTSSQSDCKVSTLETANTLTNNC